MEAQEQPPARVSGRTWCWSLWACMPSLRLPCSCCTCCRTWCTWRRPDCRKAWSCCSRCRWLPSQAALCCSMEVRHSFQAPRVRCRHTLFSRPTLRFTSASSLPLHSCSCHTGRHLSKVWRRHKASNVRCQQILLVAQLSAQPLPAHCCWTSVGALRMINRQSQVAIEHAGSSFNQLS